MDMQFLAIYWRDMKRFVRFRAILFSSLVQPIIWMLFFGLGMSSSFDSLSGFLPQHPGALTVNYLTFMGAGVIAMTTLFTSLFGGITLLFDRNWGLMKEMMAGPMSRIHILLGISLSGLTKSIVQSLIILGVGLLIGVAFFSGFGAVHIIISILGVLLFVSVFSLGFLFLSAAISMRLNSMEGVQGVMTLLTMPIFFSSNALYPAAMMPDWLNAISKVNPLTYLVNGLRYFAIGPDFYAMGTHYAYSTGDVIGSLLFLSVFALLTYILAWITFRKAVVT